MAAGMMDAELRELIHVRLGQRLPAWATTELTCTEAAEKRLRAWVNSDGLDLAPVTPVRIEAELVYLGDLAIRRVVVDTLARLPACVIYDVIDNSVIVGVGRSSNAWITAAPPRRLRAADDEEINFIAIAGEVNDDGLSRNIAHEAAHHWLEPRPLVAENSAPAARLESMKTLAALAQEWQMDEALRPMFDRAAARERRACALQSVWGFPAEELVAAACVRGAVRHLHDHLQPEGAKLR